MMLSFGPSGEAQESCAYARNINYTNRCTYACGFCAFSKGRIAEELRGAPYLLPYAEISRRTREAWSRGASETCMQGGIHPEFTGAPPCHDMLPSPGYSVHSRYEHACGQERETLQGLFSCKLRMRLWG